MWPDRPFNIVVSRSFKFHFVNEEIHFFEQPAIHTRKFKENIRKEVNG
jgi:hypothetical protein